MSWRTTLIRRQPLTVTLLNLTGTQGNATINGNNTITYNPGGGFQSLNAGQQGTDTFSYQVEDGQGGVLDAAVNVTVTGVDETAPIESWRRISYPEPRRACGASTGRRPPSRASPPISAWIRARNRLQGQHHRVGLSHRHLSDGLLPGERRALHHTSIIRQTSPATGSASRHCHWFADAGNWSVSASWNVPTDAVPAFTSRTWCGKTAPWARTTCTSWSATTTAVRT